MKCLIAVFLFYSSTNFGMHEIENKWYVSRIIIKKDRFCPLQSVAETALAVEPFYFLQSMVDNGLLTTSPVKAIRKTGNSYEIFTVNGSVYKARAKDMIKLESFGALCRFMGCDRLKMYRRRDLGDLKKEIDRDDIFVGQHYKSWIRYRFEKGDEELFTLGAELKRLKNKKEKLFTVTQDESEIFNHFR